MTRPTIADLRCEHRADAMGVGSARVRLSWRTRGLGMQRAWRVQSADDPRAFDEADPSDRIDPPPGLWDSGLIEDLAPDYSGRRSHLVPMPGPDLTSRQVRWWRVRAWGEQGRSTPWSEPARVEASLLDPADWRARWIGPSRHRPLGVYRLVRAFDLPHRPRQARLYATALGVYEARINGQPLKEARLMPGWTDYRKRLAFQTYDAGPLLRPGHNTLAFTLAEGWYAGLLGWLDPNHREVYGPMPPRLLAQLEIATADDEGRSPMRIVSDTQWRQQPCSIAESSLYLGETHRSARADPLFSQGEHDAGVERFDPPAAILQPQSDPTLGLCETLEPATVERLDDGGVRYDFGQNLAGVVELDLPAASEATGPASADLVLRHGETLNEDGTLHTANLRRAVSVDRLQWPVESPEPQGLGVSRRWSPVFTYHGFRYAELSGWPPPGSPADTPPPSARARCLRSAVDPLAELESDDELLLRIWNMVGWSLRSNLVGVLTDCPQRDERLGWLGDASAFAPAACYLMDLGPLLPKVCRDILDAQNADGSFPNYAPWVEGIMDPVGAPGYMDGAAVFPFLAWRHYRDDGPARELVGPMMRYLNYVHLHNPDLLWEHRRGEDYGDWVSPRPKANKTQTSTLLWYRSARLTAGLARAIGDHARRRQANDLARAIRRKFIDAFLSRGRLEPASQASCAMALGLGVVPPPRRETVAVQLTQLIADNDGRMHTGMIATPYLLPALSRHGEHALADRLLHERRCPSWGYMLDRGATTLWERWDADRHPPEMNSRNHFAYGSVAQWIVEDLAGLRPIGPGLGRVLIDARPTLRLLTRGASAFTRLSLRLQTPRGPLEIAYRADDGGAKLAVDLPDNTMAWVRHEADQPAVALRPGRHAFNSPRPATV